MKLLVAFFVVLSLLVCLPAAACPPATQAAFGAGYGAPMAFASAPAGCGVNAGFGAGGYGAMVAPVAVHPAYSVVNSFGVAAPLYGGFSGAAFGAPIVHVHTRPGLLGRIRAARQGFRRGF